MQNLYECPECGQAHREPAQAVLGFRAICFDCELELSDRAAQTVLWAAAA
jgi:hypothetical protein